jgi:hypothetical protein
MTRAALVLLIICAAPLLPRASAQHACVFTVDILGDANNISHIEPDLFEAIATLAPSATPVRDANVTDEKSTRLAAIFSSHEDAEVFCEDVETSFPLFFSHASSNASFAVRDAKVVEIPDLSRATGPEVDGANIEPLSFTCCGFLCLGTCPWYTVTVRCRCSRGCAGAYKFVLPQDVNPGFCRSRNAYNNGQLCTRSINMRFNAYFKFSAKSGTMAYVNGAGGSSSGTVTLTC